MGYCFTYLMLLPYFSDPWFDLPEIKSRREVDDFPLFTLTPIP